MKFVARLLVLALLMLPSAAARLQQDEFEVEFAAPAQLAGSLGFDHFQWAIIVFPDQAEASLDVQLNGVQAAWNHSSLSVSRSDYVVLGNTTSTYPARDQELAHDARFNAALDFGPGLSSLVVLAQSITLSIETRTQLSPSSSNASMDSYLNRADFPEDLLRGAYDVPAGQVVSTLFEISGKPFSIQATGIRLMEWFNADVDCSTACLPGGGAHLVGQAYPFTTETLSYIAVHSESGTLTGAGHALAVALGGKAVDVAADGYARLPAANLMGQCGPRDCPDPEGQTFRANGTMQFTNVHLLNATDGRMQAQFMGSLDAASFGETSVFGFSRGVAIWTAVSVLTFLAVAKALAALFTRHQRPALEHPRIRHVYELICAQPGLSFSDLRKLTGAGTGNMLRHLKKILDEGLVVARPYRNSQRFYENHGRYDKDWQQFAALKNDDNRMLHDWLLARPGSTQSQVLLGAAPDWSRSTLRHGLKALQAAGLVTGRKEGRFVYYWAVPLESAKRS